MANDKAEPVKVKDTQAQPNDSQVVHLPNLLELAGGVEAGLKAAKYTVQEKVAGVKQLGEQTANWATGTTIFSKESIDALGPKEHEHAKAYTTNWYFEQAGQALPLVAAVTIGHKFLGAFATKEAVAAEKSSVEGASVLQRAASLSLRPTPLGLNVRNAAAIGFASEFANPTDTKNNDSLLSSLGTRTVDGTVGAIGMAGMSLGTIGTQAAFRAAGKAIFKEAAVTAIDSAALSGETAAAKVSQNVFAKSAESTFNRIKSASGNAIIAGIGGVPGGALGYLAGAEAHGKQFNLSDLTESAVGSGVVGGMFGVASGLRGNPEAAVKSEKAGLDSPSTSIPFSARFEGATQAVRELVFGRQGDAGQLGTAMASDARGRSSADFDKLANSWESYLEFAGGEGRVAPADVEHVLRSVDNGSLKPSLLQDYADGNNSAEQKAFVAASLRPESRAAFIKMMEVSRDGSAAAQNGFAKEVSGDKQTIADLQMMTNRLSDPRLIKLVEAAATPVVEAPATTSVEIPTIRTNVGSTPIDFDAATSPAMRARVNVPDVALRQPVADGFEQLLEAAKKTGTPEQMAAFFKSVEANPKILDYVKQMAQQTNVPSIQDLAAMAEKPALRKAMMQLAEAAKEGSTAAQKQAFIDTLNSDRSTIPDWKTLANRYDDPRFKDLVRAADTADIDLVVKTQKEADDLKSATKVVENLIRSGGTDTTDLNKIVRDDDSLASLQPHLRHIAERLGGEEIAKKVDEAFAGRFQQIEVHTPEDSSFPRPEEVQTVSVRSNLVGDFNQMTEVVKMLDESLTKPQQEGDAVNPDWIYNLLKAKAQSESGKALEGSVKEYAQKTFDPRFQAFVNDAYLPAEGIVLGPERTFTAANEIEQNAFGSFATVMKGWPKVAAGETPSRDAVLNYRGQVFKYLGEHPELHEMVVRYGQQTNSSFEASAIDAFYGTKNLERFPGVLMNKEAAPSVESAELRGLRSDPVANTLIDGSLDPKFEYLGQVAKHLASPVALDTPYSKRLFNDQPRISQEQPVAGAGTWSVAEFNGNSVATITGHPENLQKIQDFADGTRIEVYGRNGETEPYTQVYFPDQSNVKVVNPGAEGSGRFKIEFPLQGNYISTDFPSDSPVVREIAWDGNLTQINRDGSVSMQKIADFKNFDPIAYDNARKVEAQAREAEQKQADARVESAKLVEVMKTATDPAARLEAAKALKPQNMSVEQFQDWLQFAFRKSPRTGAANYHELDNNASALETMRPKFVSADYDAWSARLKDYLSVPEVGVGKVSGSSAYPEWLARENVDALPNWLKGDIYQRFNAKDAGASDRMPGALADYFKANGEPQDVRKGKNGGQEQKMPFRPIGDDSVALRMDRLSDLNIAKPEVTARLMELGSQDGRALQDVIKQMTNTRNNNVEFRNLLSLTLPNAKDIYSVKLMLDALDKARAPYTPEAEKGVDLELARRAAASLTGNPVQASAAKDLVSKLYKGEVTRPPFTKGPKPGPFDTNMLANYTLAAPEAAAVADIPDELIFGSAVPKAPEAAPDDAENGTATGASAVPGSTAALDALRGKTETPPTVESPAPAAEVPAPAEVEAPAEFVESPLSPAAETLAQKIGEKLTEAGNIGENTVYQTSDGSRDFLIEPSGATYERALDKIGGQLWKNVNDQTEIWTDHRGKVWDYNSESNFAVAREVPENMTRQVFSFADEGSDLDNRHPDSPHLAPRDNVLSSFGKDGSVEFAHMDGTIHTIGPKTGPDYKPAFEEFKYPGSDEDQGLTIRINKNQAMTGTLPNGVTFTARDVKGRATMFTYPDGVAPYESGSVVGFENDTVTVTQPNGKQTVFHPNGSVEEHLSAPENHEHEEPEMSSPALDQLERLLSGDNP
ncbi:MAG: hypothetical protein P4L53_08310 [Candidatus Obscuribacterales bacterium]|nr:hypothetical protein [Candidatus Obscuribacterales bacterium]